LRAEQKRSLVATANPADGRTSYKKGAVLISGGKKRYRQPEYRPNVNAFKKNYIGKKELS
jgi:hypothetical protein